VNDAATDGTYLHMSIRATNSLVNIYLTLRKTDYKPELQLAINAIANERNEISFAFDSLDLVNGDY